MNYLNQLPRSLFYLLSIITILVGCNQSTETTVNDAEQPSEDSAVGADVREVSVSGTSNDYRFSVEVKSPDTGCDQYADWWEVIDENENLIYRRVLRHSHVDEQPFTRSGWPVEIGADKFVYVRAHMNNTGYSSNVMSGSVEEGFSTDSLSTDFASELENADPLPSNCAF